MRYTCQECADDPTWCERCYEGRCDCDVGGEGPHNERHYFAHLSAPLRTTSVNEEAPDAHTLSAMFKRHDSKLMLGCVQFGTHFQQLLTPSCGPDGPHWLTFGAVRPLVESIASQLDARRVRGAVLIVMETRLECLLVDMACVLRNDDRDLIVPVGREVTRKALRTIMAKTKPAMVVHSELTRELVEQAGVSNDAIVLNVDGDAQFGEWLVGGEYTVRDGATLGNGTRVCTFSSGSTGEPKGIVASSRNRLLSRFVTQHTQQPWVSIAWSPISSARRGCYASVIGGGRVFFVPAAEQLLPAVRLARPTAISSTPRFWVDMKVAYDDTVARVRGDGVEHAEAHRRAGDELYEALGGRLRMASTGGAPISPAVKQWLIAIGKFMVHEGMGLTEAPAVLSDEGRVRNGVQVKLRPVPEMQLDGVTSGEMLVKSPNIFTEYLGEPERTAAAFVDDGWFITGDLAEYDAERDRYQLIGRRVNSLKLAQGVFVSLERIETALGDCAHARHVVVHADGLRDHVVALVLPARADVTEADVKADFRRLAREHELAPFELPRAVYVAPYEHDFTSENGLLTGTGKVSRRAVVERYRAELDALYERTTTAAACSGSKSSESGALLSIMHSLGYDDDEYEQVAREHTLRELGGDSIAAVRFAAHLRQLGIEVDAAALLSSTTPLAEVIERAGGDKVAVDDGGGASRATTVAERAERVRAAIAEVADEDDDTRDTVLLTGANGFLGVFLLEALLRSKRTKVLAVVRARDDAAALERLLSSWRDMRLETKKLRHAVKKGRVEVVAGDLARPLLGWDKALFESVRRRLCAVLHNGAMVNHTLGSDAVRAVNVGGTATCLQLAGRSPHARFLFVSSIAAASSNAKSGYAVTKREAEKLVRLVRGELPTVVVRPGAIGPSTETGACNLSDFRILILSEVIRQGSAPQALDDAPLSFVPVDVLARHIVDDLLLGEVGARRDGHARALALVAPKPLPWRRVLECLGGAKLDRTVPLATWRARVENDGLRKLLERGFGKTTSKGVESDLADVDGASMEAGDEERIARMIDFLKSSP